MVNHNLNNDLSGAFVARAATDGSRRVAGHPLTFMRLVNKTAAKHLLGKTIYGSVTPDINST